GDEGNGDLDAYGILGDPDEASDLEGLLDPTEEQLDSPAPAIEVGNFFCAGIEIIRQDAQHLSGVGREANLAHSILHWIASAPGLACRQKADAVREDVAALGDSHLPDYVERGVGLEAGHDPAPGGIEGGPPGIVVI